MSKRRLGDAAAGILAAIFAVLSYEFPAKLPFLSHLEMKSYDARSLLRQSVDPDPEITIVAIDEGSLKQYGAWPWSRALLADLIDRIAPAQPKVIALDVLLADPQKSPGLEEIQNLAARYQQLSSQRRVQDRRHLFSLYLSSAESSLDGDARLLASMQAARNVVLPLAMAPAAGADFKPAPLPIVISSDALSPGAPGTLTDLAASGESSALYPLPAFAQAALGIGRMGFEPDRDGMIRRDFTLSRYWGSDIPSYALAVAMAATGLKPVAASVMGDEGIRAGNFYVPLATDGHMMITFNGPARTFHYDSFKDVMDGSVPAASFKDKIVFVGLTAPQAAAFCTTSVDARMPEVEAAANVTENILDRKFLARPPWAGALELLLIGAAAFFVIGVLPFLGVIWGGVLCIFAVLALMAAGSYWFVHGIWIKIGYAGGLVILGYLLVLLRRLLLIGRQEQPSADEMNKRLGLALRGHGLLDAAFEKLRLCVLSREVKAGLQALARDFETKAEYEKACAVLEYLGEHDAKFSAAAAEKIVKLKSAVLSPHPNLPPQDGKGSTPALAMLGSYEIRGDLERWEHGVFCRGWDGAAKREVMLKTLDADAGGEQHGKIKEALLRDATAAAALEHTGIARTYSAGEVGGILYAATEVADGMDVLSAVRAQGRPNIEQAARLAAAAADALDYAHAQGVFHSSLCPKCLEVLKDGALRVRDFGLAAFSSPLLGWRSAPESANCLSPEQAMGKKADGRADVFSLGVILFELLTGQKPFQSGGDVGTLVFQIANKPHPDPISLNPAIPPEIKAILDKALAKNPDDRYARASLMAEDLRGYLAHAPAVRAE